MTILVTPGAGSTLGSIDHDVSIRDVKRQFIDVENFVLRNGKTISKLRVAYETYGNLSPEKTNAILVCHGYMGSQHAAGIYAPGNAPPGVEEDEPGWWDHLIGPGRAIDTDKFFVIASNMLGSSYGTTGPASIDADTNRPYGPSFPEISMLDIVDAQRALLQALEIHHLVAIAGWSYGGYIAFQWAVAYPAMMDGIIVAASSPKGIGNDSGVIRLIDQFRRDSHWNDGWYYDNGGVAETMVDVRMSSLQRYGIENHLMDKYPRKDERIKALQDIATTWASAFDANSLIVLRRAADFYDAERDFRKIKAKVFYVLATTDTLFPPAIARDVMNRLKANLVDASYFELKTDKGHLGPAVDARKWAGELRAFLAQLGR
ncbi:alpha/beta fold hydrolase [Aquabacterium sp. A7-Y]|uniref:homoserine O-acetyltransferase family protein n=1 Tax=Aquabacterium sp. A7-Y TaxID=1349605 RepID=UPI00223D2F3C|nr:alpha/beta fold hydrolase [Aquabacterium sp. A7-Y]MCW7540971.1 alpha/beta fold hydrolase [Aquabacterium sp. A7-Y]